MICELSSILFVNCLFILKIEKFVATWMLENTLCVLTCLNHVKLHTSGYQKMYGGKTNINSKIDGTKKWL